MILEYGKLRFESELTDDEVCGVLMDCPEGSGGFAIAQMKARGIEWQAPIRVAAHAIALGLIPLESGIEYPVEPAIAAHVESLSPEAAARRFMATQPAGEPAPAPPPIHNAAKLLPIIQMFDKAADRLKFPRVEFEYLDTSVVLARTSRGQYPGSVSIFYLAGHQYVWCGRIDRDGSHFIAAGRCPNVETRCRINSALETMADDPEKFAAAYGRKSGRCCFCRRNLTDPGSVQSGYGKVCANHFGLSWPRKD
ncbi:MAG: hypothetical protein IT450_18080 [Phycisphaerales bacterium]|nr:hypothetical protein [Phycisphaerales bacterium]